jgi:transposase
LAVKKSTSAAANIKIQGNWDEAEVIGIDLGDRMSHFVGLDSNGEVRITGRVASTATAIDKYFRSLESKLIAIETGTHSPWVSRLLSHFGHRVVVANSRQLRLIYENRRKNDQIDAEYLARLVRIDPKLLKPVVHRSEDDQRTVALLRSRDKLVRTRSGLITHARGLAKSIGLRVPACSAEAFVKRATPVVPAALKASLEPVLRTIDHLNKEIAGLDRRIEQLARTEYPAAQLLMQIPGVGPVTSVAFVATLGNAERFAKSRTAGAWVGLTPGQAASGQQDPQMRITKEGDHYLRRLLVSCAQYILGPHGPDCDLRRHGLALAARGGKNAKKRAVVAVARKLAVLLHKLWRTGAVYEPLYNAKATRLAA